MKKNKIMLLILAGIIISSAAFSPYHQDAQTTPTAVLDANSISAQIEEKLTKKYDEMVAALEVRISALEEQTKKDNEVISTLQYQASLPTLTPAPSMTMTAKVPAAAKGTPTGTVAPTATLSPLGYGCEQTVTSPYFFGQFNAGAHFNFNVTLKNTGTKPWGSEVLIKFSDGLKAETSGLYAYSLPVKSVAPGESIDISIPMTAPVDKTEASGKYQSVYVLNNGEEDFCTFYYSIYVP